jgi:hypothetical protein
VQRCDAILSTAIACASIGALIGVVVATGTVQMLINAVIGVWGGAIAGGLLGALRCVVGGQRREHGSGAGSDLGLEAPKKLRPAGL